MEYKIVYSQKGVKDLEKLVNEDLEGGWKPTGGLSVSQYNLNDENNEGNLVNKTIIAQALVR
jgi:hypothetical protein